LREKKYDGESYSQSGSFREQSAVKLAVPAQPPDSPPPHPVWTMKEMQSFGAVLARAKNKLLVDAAYCNKTLSISQTNRIIKAVREEKTTSDQSNSNPKKTRQTGDIVASIAAVIENDQWITVREYAPLMTCHLGPSMPSSLMIWA
jgi:hypothetical protein